MLSFHYTITNNSNGKSFTIGQNDDGTTFCEGGGGLGLQQYPSFEMDIRNEERARTGQHGIWDFFSFYGKRAIVFQGLIIEDSHADLITKEQLMQEVLSLPAQPSSDNDGYVTISWTDDAGITWEVDAKLQEDIQFRRNMGQTTQADFFISLKAKDPIIFNSVENQIVQVRGWRQGIMVLPAFLPSMFNIAYSHVVNLYQKGNTDGPARFRLWGSAVQTINNPKVTRLDATVAHESAIVDMTDAGWVGGALDIVNVVTGTASRKVSSVAGAQAVATISGVYDLDFDDLYEEEQLLSACDNVSDFVTKVDGANITLDTITKQEGTGSVKFDIDVSLSASDEGGVAREGFNGIDISTYEEPYMEYDFYIPDVTEVTGLYSALGSDSNVNGRYGVATLNKAGGALVNGWNKIRIAVSDMTTDYGSGLAFGAIDSLDVRLQYNVAQADMSDCRIDNVKVGGKIRREFVELECFIDDVSNLISGGYVASGSYIKFIETAGVDEFAISLSNINETLQDGWNKLLVLKENFDSIGNPSWGDITDIELSVQALGSTDLDISFSNIRVSNQSFAEKKIEITTVLTDDSKYIEIDLQEGTVVDQDGLDLSASVTLDSEWFKIKPEFDQIVYESDENPVITAIDPTERFDVFWRDAII